MAEVQAAFDSGGIKTQPIPGVPYGLRLIHHEGAVTQTAWL